MAKRPKYDELKKRVEALEKENQELVRDLAKTRSLLENVGNPMGLYDPEGTLLMMNRQGAANLKGVADDFVGKKITALFPENGHVYLERIREVFKTGSTAEYEDKVTVPGGKKWFLSTYQAVRDESQTPFAVQIVSVDITERKRTREILLRSEERFRALYQADPTAAFTWQKKGEDFVLVDCNHAADVLTQGRAARFFGKAAGEIYRNRPDIVQDLHQCLAERKTTRRQMWSERFLPGRLIDVTYAFVPPDLIMVHVQDITERKRAEEEIAERSRLLEAIFTNHLTCLVLLDRDFNFIRVNEAYARACAREVSEFPGHNHFEFYPSEAQSIFEEVVRTKKPFQISARPFVFPDHPEWGVTYWDWTLVPILDRAGEVEFLVFSLNNVSERVQAEAALRERKEYLTQLMNTLGDAVFTVRVQERRIEYVNRAATTIFGYLPEEMIGQAARMFYPDDAGSAAFGQRLQDALAQGQKQFSAELKLRRKDGQPVWGEVHSTFLLRDGQPSAVISVVRDVTERKQTEERYRGIFENAVEGIFQSTPEGRFLSANPAFAKMYGYDSPQDLIANVSDERHQHYVNPEDRTSFQKALEEHGSVKGFVTEVYRKDGSRIWVSINARAIRGSDGGILYYEGMVEDITERKRAEEGLRASEKKYRTLFEMESDAILLIDDQTLQILDANAAAVTLYKYSREELLARKVVDVSAEPEKTLQTIRQKTAGVPLRWHLKKDGTWVPVEITRSLFEWKGRMVHVAAIRDISSRVEAERQLRETREQLFQAQKMETLGTLVAGIAHEINNPINLILFNAPLLRKIWHDLLPVLQERAASEPQRKYGGLAFDFLESDLDRLLADMELAGNRVATIVKGLKDFARKSDVKDKKPTALNEAVENAIRMAESTVRKSGVQLRVELGTDLPAMVGNIQSVEQIVLNIAFNAVQAIKHDRGVVAVRTGYDERRGGLTLHISDNGEGIDPSLSGRIFDPFFTSRQAEGGTGLGLAVTYSLVKEHDGEISFESEVGKGTTFKVFFPVWPRSKMIKVLAVDDDEFVLDMIKRAFDRVPAYETETAMSGTEALIKLATHPPDVLILDLSMPGMDGVEVCRVLQRDRRFSKIKVIIITGFPHDPRLEEMKKMGYGHIYVKPLGMKELEEEVGRIATGEERFA